MSTSEAIGGGLVGACALTLLHETTRRLAPDAPRMDILGMRAIAKAMRGLNETPPSGDQLHKLALAGDVIANSLYYSLVSVGGPERAILNGALLGLAAGVGAVVLPGPLGLGEAPSSRTAATSAMTIGLYVAGGLAAGAAYRLLRGTSSRTLLRR